MVRRIPVALLAVLLGAASLASARAQGSALDARAVATAQPQAQVTGAPVTPAPVPSLAPSPPAEPSVAPGRPGASSPAAALPRIPGVIVPGAGATQPYATFVKGATVQNGVIDLIRKDDDLYFDLKPENFDHTYVIAPSIERGVGSGAWAGRVYDPIPVTFKLVGKRVLWITPNTRYVAPKGSAAANSLAISVGDSVILSTPVVAEDKDKKHLVVAPSLFLTDFENVGADLGRAATPPSLPGLLVLVIRPTYAVDATKSYYGRTKTFPRNDEISVDLAFNGPPNAMPTVPDGRGIPVVMHYSIISPPERDPHFVPRLADDRVGYFITARKSYGNDAAKTPFERFIERWNLDDGPITFYLTDEIPKEYRDTVRRGILAWNDAFARIGHPHAIVVKDPPSDPNWDPDDARYTTVRWITSDEPDWSAYSPHVSDPDTGQIVRAEVVIDGESLRAIKSGYIDRVLPAERLRRSASALSFLLDPTALTGDGDEASESEDCTFEQGSVVQAALGSLLLAQNPRTTAAERERYAQQWLYSTVLHEVGHTLGLRHNFEGSTAYTYKELHDPAFTAKHGTTGSVMDYTPANIAAPGERQAAYFPTKLGPYDYWAIEYGYRTFPNVRSSADEAIPLSRIASRSTQPGLAYGTDEDAIASSVDPRIQPFDLSSDPLAYVDEQFRVDDDVVARLTKTFPGDTRSFQDLRAGLVTVLNNELEDGVIAAKYVGGIYTSRAHRGEPGAPPPFTPVPRAQQLRAFRLLDRYVLSSNAFRFSPQLLNEVAPSRYGVHWGADRVPRSDFPVREVIAELQDGVIEQLFSPVNLARVGDEELKVRRPSDTMSLADLFAWTNAAIYDDVGKTTIEPTHRELQRRFADLQMVIVALPAQYADRLDLPRETQALARYNLVKLAARLPAAIRAARDEGTRAHLTDLRVRVAGVLHAQNTRQI
ncbi:MAG TPA: zinc-dependent metalloprotease [Candidatus Baltobacteraceae bacterium]|nr:zinc-dependent metalloprotease [Candidatus Baltobacteraceae bacterium]